MADTTKTRYRLKLVDECGEYRGLQFQHAGILQRRSTSYVFRAELALALADKRFLKREWDASLHQGRNQGR